jgi:hypothetical protein
VSVLVGIMSDEVIVNRVRTLSSEPECEASCQEGIHEIKGAARRPSRPVCFVLLLPTSWHETKIRGISRHMAQQRLDRLC